MRKTMKTTLAVLASLALIPAAATASYRVGSPFPGDVTATTYYSSGTFHGAVDISSRNACGYWGVETGVVGSMSWNVTIRTTGDVCYGNGSGNQNEVKHTFANGYVVPPVALPQGAHLGRQDLRPLPDRRRGRHGQRHRPPHPHAVRPLRHQQHLLVLGHRQG